MIILKKHNNRKLEGVRYPWNECEHAATTASDFRRHIEIKHEGMRYSCDKCEYVATTASVLENILRIYMKE